MLKENRAHPALMNIIGELCAQFRKGILAVIRSMGRDAAIRLVAAYHRLDPQAAGVAWHPESFDRMDAAEFQQLYVNAEHDGEVGVITLGRESYNWDVDDELNRAIDWLKAAGIERVIVSGDFHLTAQLTGADTAEFYPALDDATAGEKISASWSRTARRLHEEFRASVGFIGGKRCLGGLLELMLHCHYQVAVESAELGLPEVTLPVVPGMEGVHWPFRRAGQSDWPKLVELLLGGRPIHAGNAVGWLVDFAGPLEDAIEMAFRIVKGGDHGIACRDVATGPFEDIRLESPDLPAAAHPDAEAARKAVADAIRAACSVPLAEALDVQARHSAGFMTSRPCIDGRIGADRRREMTV
jgi:enoyl-CoA hydratase/carnithine racemase